jgi:hypothetical protein
MLATDNGVDALITQELGKRIVILAGGFRFVLTDGIGGISVLRAVYTCDSAYESPYDSV